MKLLRRRSKPFFLVAGWTAFVPITFVCDYFMTILPDPHFSSGFKAIHAFIRLVSLATARVVARIGLQSRAEERSIRGRPRLLARPLARALVRASKRRRVLRAIPACGARR